MELSATVRPLNFRFW